MSNFCILAMPRLITAGKKHTNMTSRISIEIDFDNGQPYIKINEDRNSDDVRDKLITFFRQRLGHTSSWCAVQFFDQSEVGNQLVWRIRPITSEILEEQCKAMTEQVRLNKEWEPKESLTH